MPKLSEANRGRITGMLDTGMSVSETARQMGVARAVVRLWRERVRLTDSVKDLPRSGRPRVTSANQYASVEI